MKIYDYLDELPQIPGTLAVWYRPAENSNQCHYVMVISPDQAVDAIEVLEESGKHISGLKIFMDDTWREWYHDNGMDIHEMSASGDST